MKQRTITGIIFAAAMLGGIYGGRYSFYFLFAVITAGALWELGGMLFGQAQPGQRGAENGKVPVPYGAPAGRRIILAGLGLVPFAIAGWQTVETGQFDGDMMLRALAVVLLGIFVLFIVELFQGSERPFSNLGHYALGVAYIGMPFTLLTYIAMWTGEYSPNRVFGLLFLVWTNDVAAYLIGSRIGKNKLFPRISPGKTWEGTIGALVATVLMALLLAQFLPDYTRAQWLVLAAIASVLGTIGDLVESMLKRSYGVKDSGTILPGHGGFLDRFDAYLFTLPFAWAALALGA